MKNNRKQLVAWVIFAVAMLVVTLLAINFLSEVMNPGDLRENELRMLTWRR